jgi:hypothetical protein
MTGINQKTEIKGQNGRVEVVCAVGIKESELQGQESRITGIEGLRALALAMT